MPLSVKRTNVSIPESAIVPSECVFPVPVGPSINTFTPAKSEGPDCEGSWGGAENGFESLVDGWAFMSFLQVESGYDEVGGFAIFSVGNPGVELAIEDTVSVGRSAGPVIALQGPSRLWDRIGEWYSVGWHLSASFR